MVGLVDGQLQLRVNGGTGELLLAANGTFSNNVFHTVSVLKSRRRWVLGPLDMLGQRIAPSAESTGLGTDSYH